MGNRLGQISRYFEGKAGLFRLIGAPLWILGALLSYLHISPIITVVGIAMIVVGLLLSGITQVIRVANRVRFHRELAGIDIAERISYGVAAVSLVVVVVLAYLEIFFDVVTYIFGAALIVAVIFWFCRRLLHLF